MSTYTDLHNKIKETVNVDYHTRATNQEVKFLNNENEYWGTLRGNVELNGGVLSNVTLVGATLKNVELPGGLNIDQVDKAINGISAQFDALEEQTGDEIDRLKNDFNTKITSIKEDAIKEHIILSGLYHSLSTSLSTGLHNQDDLRKDLKDELETKINDLGEELETKINDLGEELSGKLSIETDIRISIDTKLSTNIDNLSTEFITKHTTLSNFVDDLSAKAVLSASNLNSKIEQEAAERIKLENRISEKIDDVISTMVSEDEKLLSAIEDHRIEAKEELSATEDRLLNTILHDKHYEINESGLTSTYPYQLKDYSVNIVRTNTVDGYVYYKDPSNVIGKVSKMADGGLKLEVFNFKDQDIANALTKSTFIFKDNNLFAPTNHNGYTIEYDKQTELSNSTFKLNPDPTPYLDVYQNGVIIGKIKDYKIVDDTVVEGLLIIDTANSLLTSFNEFAYDKFSPELSAINRGSNRIIYNGNNSFTFYKNITIHNFEELVNTLSNDNYVFGKIYKEGGLLTSNAGIEEITVNLDAPYNQTIKLDRANNFTITLDTLENDTLTIVSADVDHSNFEIALDVVEVNELYKYDFRLSDDFEGTGKTFGWMVAETPNKDIEYGQFGKLSVNLEEIVAIPAFKGIVELEIDNISNLKTWRATKDDINGNVLEVNFDGTYLNIWIYNKEVGYTRTSKYRIDLNSKSIFNTETAHKHVYTSAKKIFKFEASEEQYDSTYTATTNTLVKENTNGEEYKLDIDIESASTIKFTIPEKPFKDISREFFVAIKVLSDTDQDISLEFVDEAGEKINFVSSREYKLFVKPNIFTTMMFNEINHDTFLITDLDHNVLDNKLEKYNKDLNEKIDTVSFNLSTDLSVLSSEVIDISTNLQEQITSNDEDIYSLSAQLSAETKRSSKNMTFWGDVELATEYKDLEGGAIIENQLFGLLLTNSYHKDDRTRKIREGFAFRTSGETNVIYTLTDSVNTITLRNNELIIFNKDVDQVQNVTLSDIFVIKDYDLSSNLLQEQIISNDEDIENLSTEINDINVSLSECHLSVETLSNEFKDISNSLQEQITSNDTDITSLSDQVLANDTDITSLSDQVLANDTDITNISSAINLSVENLNNMDKELSADLSVVRSEFANQLSDIYGRIKGAINYKGAIQLFDDGTYFISTISAMFLADSAIGDKVIKPLYDDPGTILSNGFMYAVSKLDESPNSHFVIEGLDIEAGDYVIINNKNGDGIAISSMTSADIDIIDAMDDNLLTIERADELSSEINTRIKDLSSELHTKIDNNVLELSNAIDDEYDRAIEIEDELSSAISSEIETRISEDGKLSDAIDVVSASVAACHLSVNTLSNEVFDLSTDLQEQITSNDEDITNISAHYNKTFVKDQKLNLGDDISVDFLKLTDATDTAKSYTMQLSAGTIVLVPIKK